MKTCLQNLRKHAPRIHSITNYVTANDCANMLLACGASAIMADEKMEVEEVTALCDGLCLNLGTLRGTSLDAMLLAGKKANALNHPVVLDPVGVGTSALRTHTAQRLMQEIRFSAIRGNISEMKTLAGISASTQGVEANAADSMDLDAAIAFAKAFSRETGAIIALTGPEDIVCNGENAYVIRNGHPMMAVVTGAGCQLSVLTAAFVTANPQNPLLAAACAVCAMGLAGEIAHKRLTPLDGNASYRNYLIDAIYNMTPEQLEQGARYTLR